MKTSCMILAFGIFVVLAPGSAVADAASYDKVLTCDVVYQELVEVSAHKDQNMYTKGVVATDEVRDILIREGAAIGKDEKSVNQESYDRYNSIAAKLTTRDKLMAEVARCDEMLGLGDL